MKHTLAVFLLSIVAALADITPIVQWDIETGKLEPKPYAISIRRGESVYLEPRFVNYSAAINLTGATVQMRYSPDNTMASYYAVTGSLMAATGRVHIGWADYLNPTNDALYYEIRATVGTNVLARSYGTLTLLWGIGGVNTGLTARTSINWATVDQAGGTAVLAAMMGSGASWNGTQWTFGAGTVDLSFTNLYYRASNPSNYCTLAAAVAWTNSLEFGPHTGLPYYPANNPSGYVSSAGATYTFANTNAAVGVYTNGTVIFFGTNQTGGGLTAANVTNDLNLAVSPSLTQTVAKASTALQAIITNGAPIGDYGMSAFTVDAVKMGKLFPAISFVGYDESENFYSNSLAILSDGFYRLRGTQQPVEYTYKIYDEGNFLAGTHYLSPSGPGSNLTGITAAQVGSVATNDARYLASLTNLSPSALAAAGGVTTSTVLRAGTAITLNGATNDVPLTNGTITIASTAATESMRTPLARIHMVNNQALAASTITKLVVTNTTLDTGSGLNTALNRYEFPTNWPGYYSFSGYARFAQANPNECYIYGYEVTPQNVTNLIFQSNSPMIIGQYSPPAEGFVTYTGGLHYVYILAYSAGLTNTVIGAANVGATRYHIKYERPL